MDTSVKSEPPPNQLSLIAVTPTVGDCIITWLLFYDEKQLGDLTDLTSGRTFRTSAFPFQLLFTVEKLDWKRLAANVVLSKWVCSSSFLVK